MVFQNDPDPAQLEQRVRDRLADSLAHVFERTAAALDVAPAQAVEVVDRVRAARVLPGVVARYFDLVFSIECGDQAGARRLAAQIVELAPASANFDVRPYTYAELGEDFERFARLGFATYTHGNPMAAPAPELCESHRSKLARARTIIDGVDASIGAELDALLSRVYIAVNNPTAARSFGGVSSLMTWGAVFVNARAYRSMPEVVNFLVHEITHLMLFAHSALAPLVRNPPTQRYRSPLRREARPMDGVYHATMVCARLLGFAERYLQSGTADRQGRDWANDKLARLPAVLRDGVSIVREHADLSAQGWTFLEAAEARLRAYAS